MTHAIEVEHEGIVIPVTFRAIRGRDGYHIEDTNIVGVKDPSDELEAAVDAAIVRYVEDGMAYERSGF